MWFIGVEEEQETSAPPPKKILDPPLLRIHEHPGAVSRRAYQGSSSYLLSHGAFWVIKII